MRRTRENSHQATGDVWASCVPAGAQAEARKGGHARPRRAREAPRPVPSLVRTESGEGACASGPKRGGAKGRFFVTPHAVESYRSRVRGGIGYDRALRELISLTSYGRFVESYRGLRLPQFEGARLELWRGPRIGPNRNRGRQRIKGDARDRLRFVVAYGPGELPQVVSVLPIGRRWEPCV